MGLYVYCPRRSTSAFDLVKELGAKRLRKFDGLNFWDKKTKIFVEPASSIVCWGTTLESINGYKVLNSRPDSMNKYQELVKLSMGGVSVPQPRLPEPGTTDAEFKKAGYLGRTFWHQEGNDFLKHTWRMPDYYTKKINFVKEFRLHTFLGKSIRAGEKVVKKDHTLVESEKLWKPDSNLAHPWIRSYNTGWYVRYDGFSSTPEMRAISNKACKLLGLSFAAVDLGMDAGGKLYVIEINTAPGIEGGTLKAYAKAITKWYEGEPEGPADPVEVLKPKPARARKAVPTGWVQ